MVIHNDHADLVISNTPASRPFCKIVFIRMWSKPKSGWVEGGYIFKNIYHVNDHLDVSIRVYRQ